MTKKESGIFLPVFSLSSPYGPGCFSEEAYKFIDAMASTGHQYWQVLPFAPVGKGNSPYLPVSVFAGNPAFIDPGALAEDGLVTAAELEELAQLAAAAPASSQDQGTSAAPASSQNQRATAAPASSQNLAAGAAPMSLRRQGALRSARDRLLRLAYSRVHLGDGYAAFCEANRDWLADACLFMALKSENKNRPWRSWPRAIKYRDPVSLSALRTILQDEIGYRQWCQYLFFQQWEKLRAYAHAHHVEIIGDLPIYVSPEGADVWSHPELFQLDSRLRQTGQAGVPPDAFSADGQLWGNPLYRWEDRREAVYRWWFARIQQTFQLFDVVRIDHFRAFESYWRVPAGATTAACGSWVPGPGMDFFRQMERAIGRKRFLAEDLGIITDQVRDLIQQTGYPGMKVLQFAFDGNPDNDYLPHGYPENCVVYTGTHDNDTLLGWYAALSHGARQQVEDYLQANGLGQATAKASAVATGLMALAEASRADLAILSMVDFLPPKQQGRINIPGTPAGNWVWQMPPDALTPEVLAAMTNAAKTRPR